MRFPDKKKTLLVPHNNISNSIKYNVVKKIKHQNIHSFNELKQSKRGIINPYDASDYRCR